jgi:hypothetical protein
MKILFALTPALHAHKGGVQHTTLKLGQFFNSQGIEVFYYSFESTGHQEVIHGSLFHAELTGNTSNEMNIKNFILVVNTIKPDFVINQMPYDLPLRLALKHLKEEVGFYLIACIRNSLFSFLQNYKEIISRKLRLPGKLHFPALYASAPVIKGFHKLKHTKVLKSILDIHDRLVLLTEANKREVFFL